jgi:hypothetical protein
LPAPWVPFTRYDDDLGPVQGRRRAVKNEGQQADLASDKKISYEGRDGSAIVSNEIEETWSIKTDEDGNSLFPIRDRDFYDASRGAVQERRQLFVPTGEEVGSLENINGVITQTSYEPYNEFLSVKIVQTYKVDGPLLIGKVTDEARQLATVTIQRKGASDYVPPNPTATRTVEVSREDTESLVERVVEVPEVFGAQAYRKTREDITPQKFKAAQEDTAFEQTVEGTANPNIVLDAGEFVKSEEQINKFTKRVATTSRAITSAVTLNEKVLTPQGQIGSRLLRLQFGDQSFDSELLQAGRLIDGSVEALGDERTILSQTSVPSVFSGKTVQKTRIDLTPEKFKAKQEDTTTEETTVGAVDPAITLGVGEFRKSEEQVTEFVKRISTTKRDISTSLDLEEFLITPQGQLAKRTLTLSGQAQAIQPDALLIDGSIEDLGDRRTIKTEVRVPNVFSNKINSIERPDPVPQKFRVLIPVKTQEESLAGAIVNPTLSTTATNTELSKSEQQVTEFVKRIRTTSRDLSAGGQLVGYQFTSDLGGGTARVEETYPYSGPFATEPSNGTIEEVVEDLGDGTFLKRKIILPQKNSGSYNSFWTDNGNIYSGETLPILRGQDYDEELDLVIPYKQVVADPSNTTISEGKRRRVTPRDVAHSVVQKYNIEDVQAALNEYYWEIPDMINIQLPNRLLSVGVAVNGSGGTSTTTAPSGNTYSVSNTQKGSVGGTLYYDIEEGFNGVVPTVRAIFFLPKDGASPDDVLARVRLERNDQTIKFWPNARPKSYQIAIVETGSYQETSQSVSFDSTSSSVSTGGDISTKIATIPPTIHEDLDIKQTGSLATGSGVISVTPNQLQETEISQFDVGFYIYQINATPYKFSYVRVDALLVDLKEEYV